MKVEGENNEEESQGESFAAQHWHGVRVKIHGCREGEGTHHGCVESFIRDLGYSGEHQEHNCLSSLLPPPPPRLCQLSVLLSEVRKSRGSIKRARRR